MMATTKVDLKWMAEQFLRGNPALADKGEARAFIDEPGHCGRSAAFLFSHN